MASVPIKAPSNLNEDTPDIVQQPKTITRDYRFNHIIESQLGTNGMYLLVCQSVLFIFALIIIVAVMIGSLFTNWQANNNPATVKTTMIL